MTRDRAGRAGLHRFDPWIAAAATRPLVTLPDGRTGRLIHVTPRSDVATVLCAGRRHRVPTHTLTITEEPPTMTSHDNAGTVNQ